MKKKILISVTIWIVIFVAISLAFDPFNIKKLVGQANKEEDIKELFEDKSMYNCVLSSYFDYYFSDENMYSAMSDFYSTYEGTIDIYELYKNMYGMVEPKLTREDLLKITDLSCDNVSDTSGIEYIPNLKTIRFYSGNFEKLDLTNQKDLDYLYITVPSLSDLNVKSNEKLEQIDISSEKLTELDLSNNPLLKNITLNTKIKKLDLTGVADNARLTSNNRFEEIKVLKSFAKKNSVTSLSTATKLYEKKEENKLEEIGKITYKGNYRIGEINYNYSGNSWPYDATYSEIIVTDLDSDISKIKELYNVENGSVKLCASYENCSEEVGADQSIEHKYVVLVDEDGNRLDSNYINLFNNSVFKDYYLYEDIISTYNNIHNLSFWNGTNKTTKDLLTDEELSTITYINPGNVCDTTGIEKLTGLTSITIYGNFEEIDLSNYKNLTTATISGDYLNPINNVNLSNNELLKELTISNINEIDLSKNTLLEKLSISGIKKPLNLSSNVNLKNLQLNSYYAGELNVDNNTKLTTLYINGSSLKSIDLANLKDLERLTIYADVPKINLSNNNKITYLDISNNVEEIKGLDDLPLEELELASMTLKDVDFVGNKNIYSVSIMSPVMEKIDLTGVDNLQMLTLLTPNLNEIKGVEDLSLMAFIAPNNQIEELDLSNSTNLMAAMVSFSKLSKNKVNMLKGEKITLPENFKFTDTIKTDTFNEDDFVATYDISTKEIEANSYGQTAITRYYIGMDLFSGEMAYYPLKTYVNVFDIKSSKYEVNKELGYIYVGTEDNDKAINRYVKVYGEEVSKKLEDNKFTILSNKEKVRTFDVIKVSSSKYDMNSNEIIYSGEFDISKIKITNAKLEVIEDELQINYKGNVIRTFKLTKEEK